MGNSKEKKVGVVLGHNLGQIRSNVVKKVKKLALSINVFHMLHREYILKQEIVVAQTPEWKVKVNIARNTRFEGRQGQIFALFESKIAKTDSFQEFHFSQS